MPANLSPPRTSTQRWPCSSWAGTPKFSVARRRPRSMGPHAPAAGRLSPLARTLRGSSNPRGWSEREALAAAAKPDAFEVLPLGQPPRRALAARRRPAPDPRPPLHLHRHPQAVDTAVTLDRYRRDEKQRAALWPAEALDDDRESLWVSEQMTELLDVARRIAPTPLSVLLTGETGTGKEMLARAIHRASDRADRPFLPFNCTAVPRDMLESQLFGYRKGAFTGADTSFDGVIRAAAGGTLFLDEIAEIGLELQPKLLRFLETHEIHPLGEPQPIKVDVRVIAATNADLEQLVADGRFREDLFYRLNVVRLRAAAAARAARGDPAARRSLPAEVRRRTEEGPPDAGATRRSSTCCSIAWPGNVRQLVNEVSRMVAMAEPDSTLTPALLSPEIQASRRTVPAMPARRAGNPRPPRPAAERRRQMLEQTMVPPRARSRARALRERRAAAGDLAQGPVPQAPALGLPPAILITGPILRSPPPVGRNYRRRVAPPRCLRVGSPPDQSLDPAEPGIEVLLC